MEICSPQKMSQPCLLPNAALEAWSQGEATLMKFDPIYCFWPWAAIPSSHGCVPLPWGKCNPAGVHIISAAHSWVWQCESKRWWSSRASCQTKGLVISVISAAPIVMYTNWLDLIQQLGRRKSLLCWCVSFKMVSYLLSEPQISSSCQKANLARRPEAWEKS